MYKNYLILKKFLTLIYLFGIFISCNIGSPHMGIGRPTSKEAFLDNLSKQQWQDPNNNQINVYQELRDFLEINPETFGDINAIQNDLENQNSSILAHLNTKFMLNSALLAQLKECAFGSDPKRDLKENNESDKYFDDINKTKVLNDNNDSIRISLESEINNQSNKPKFLNDNSKDKCNPELEKYLHEVKLRFLALFDGKIAEWSEIYKFIVEKGYEQDNIDDDFNYIMENSEIFEFIKGNLKFASGLSDNQLFMQLKNVFIPNSNEEKNNDSLRISLESEINNQSNKPEFLNDNSKDKCNPELEKYLHEVKLRFLALFDGKIAEWSEIYKFIVEKGYEQDNIDDDFNYIMENSEIFEFIKGNLNFASGLSDNQLFMQLKNVFIPNSNEEKNNDSIYLGGVNNNGYNNNFEGLPINYGNNSFAGHNGNEQDLSLRTHLYYVKECFLRNFKEKEEKWKEIENFILNTLRLETFESFHKNILKAGESEILSFAFNNIGRIVSFQTIAEMFFYPNDHYFDLQKHASLYKNIESAFDLKVGWGFSNAKALEKKLSVNQIFLQKNNGIVSFGRKTDDELLHLLDTLPLDHRELSYSILNPYQYYYERMKLYNLIQNTFPVQLLFELRDKFDYKSRGYFTSDAIINSLVASRSTVIKDEKADEYYYSLNHDKKSEIRDIIDLFTVYLENYNRICIQKAIADLEILLNSDDNDSNPEKSNTEKFFDFETVFDSISLICKDNSDINKITIIIDTGIIELEKSNFKDSQVSIINGRPNLIKIESTTKSTESIIIDVRKIKKIQIMDEEDGIPCSICHAHDDKEMLLVNLSCGHQFHFICARQWIINYGKKKCPFCRIEVSNKEYDRFLPKPNKNKPKVRRNDKLYLSPAYALPYRDILSQ